MKKLLALLCITCITYYEIKAGTRTPKAPAQKSTQELLNKEKLLNKKEKELEELLAIARSKFATAIALQKTKTPKQTVPPQANQQLLKSAQTGDFEKVRALITQGDTDINTKDLEGKTPLMHAIIHSWYYKDEEKTKHYEQIVELLLHAKAQWLGADNKGKTATLYAMERNIPDDKISQMLNQKYFEMIQIR